MSKYKKTEYKASRNLIHLKINTVVKRCTSIVHRTFRRSLGKWLLILLEDIHWLVQIKLLAVDSSSQWIRFDLNRIIVFFFSDKAKK